MRFGFGHLGSGPQPRVGVARSQTHTHRQEDSMALPTLSDNALEKRDRWAAFRGLSWWQLVLSLLPLVLIGLGGLVGGAVGGAGAWLNLKVARRSLHPAVKALVMIVV